MKNKEDLKTIGIYEGKYIGFKCECCNVIIGYCEYTIFETGDTYIYICECCYN